MPQTKQAAKRLKQSNRQAIRNKAVKSKLKTLEKGLRESVDKGDVAEAATRLKVLSSAFDSAAGKGKTTKNRAARKKSRLAILVNKTASQSQ